MSDLITPARAAELRRSAAHHAAMVLITTLQAGWCPEHYFPDEAERDLVLEEVERIAYSIKDRALIGSRQPCSACAARHLVKADGTTGYHHGTNPEGFSTGKPCPGVNERPSNPAHQENP